MRRCGTWAKHAGVPHRRVGAVEGAGRLFSTPSRPALRAATRRAPGEPASPTTQADPAGFMLRCSWRQGILWPRGGLTKVGGPQAIGGARWKEPSNPTTTTTSTPSGTKTPTSMPTTTSTDRRALRPPLDRLPVLRQVLEAGPDALPGQASDHGPQHLSPRGRVDLQRVRCPDGADTRRGALKTGPKLAGMDTWRPHRP